MSLRNSAAIASLFAIVSLCSVSRLSGDENGSQEQPTLETINWMTGNWTTSEDGSQIDEHWMAPAGGLMLGMGRTVKSGKKPSFEFMRIEQTNAGLTFYAMPNGAPATPFKAIEATPEKVTFENRSNDFPQRVRYWRDGEKLRARIEGDINGQTESMEWCWTKS